MVAAGQFEGCFTHGSNGAYLWTAGTKLDPRYPETPLVWNVTTADSFMYYPIIYKNWNAGEPNNWNGAEDCVNLFMAKALSWNDQKCSDATCFVCQFPV